MRELGRAAAALGLATVVAGCANSASPEATAPSTEAAARPSPTIVTRITPEVVVLSDPLEPVESEEIPGVVVPAGATLTDFEPATGDADARADYHMDGIDPQSLRDWFSKELPAVGWAQGRDMEGSLMFLHTTQLSARYAREGLKRTCMVHFESTDDGVDFAVIAEEPEGE